MRDATGSTHFTNCSTFIHVIQIQHPGNLLQSRSSKSLSGKENVSRRSSGDSSLMTSSRSTPAAMNSSANHHNQQQQQACSRSKRSIRLRSLPSTPPSRTPYDAHARDDSRCDVAVESSVAFADRSASAAVPENYTQLQLAQLYAHIAGMPEGAKKRKLVKKVTIDC